VPGRLFVTFIGFMDDSPTSVIEDMLREKGMRYWKEERCNADSDVEVEVYCACSNEAYYKNNAIRERVVF
jgi:hypothetical protein